MANIYSNWPFYDGASFSIANRHTDRLILAWHALACATAESPPEISLAAWIGERAEARGVNGCCGFGLEQLPWSDDLWEHQRDFMASTCRQLGESAFTWPLGERSIVPPISPELGPFMREKVHSLHEWFAAWSDTSMARLRAAVDIVPIGLAWTPLRPYPEAFASLAWFDVPLDRCDRHGMWCPTPPEEEARCAICDYENDPWS